MKILSALVVLLLLQACKHPLAIEGEGDIIERLAGLRGCSLEEFQANSPRCTENDVVDEDYIVSYEGVPRPGWRFVTWRAGTPCSKESVAPYCEYNVAQSLVALMDEEFPDLVLPATVAVFGQPDTWKTKTEMPTGRAGVGLCTINNKLYVIGGQEASTQLGVATVEEYDPSTDSWATRADMPTPRMFMAASAVNGKCYVIGGVASESSPPLTTVEEYDPQTDTWQAKASLPSGRLDTASAVVNGKIYVVGGATSFASGAPAVSSTAIYDPTTNKWSTGADMPTPRLGMGVASIDGLIYGVGGRRGGSMAPTDTVERYNPGNDKWTTRSSMPTRRSWLSASADGSALFAIGGLAVDPVLSVVERYDPESDQWVSVADMPETRWTHGSATLGGRILVVGGFAGHFGPQQALKVVQEYTP